LQLGSQPLQAPDSFLKPSKSVLNHLLGVTVLPDGDNPLNQGFVLWTQLPDNLCSSATA